MIWLKEYCKKVNLIVSSNIAQGSMNFKDIVQIIGEKEWYNEKKSRSRESLYHMVYGMWKVGYDNWVMVKVQNICNKYEIIPQAIWYILKKQKDNGQGQ